ncbi:uncharacterized protein LOC130083501 [Rhinichthys klamathensis goyatoka]|uniref:uncharacterized protein LOC130083501 n=1 Tax=Rhinichthys klamathensis goyatoka TaxID=3034132 RepID=UPI0024B5FD49|nr:uncharacterized protein LOC130083501 [Rhinichthys klamathensis goyatoka]
MHIHNVSKCWFCFDTGLLIIVLVSTGVGVICSGLIYPCWFACNKRRHRNKTRSITSDVPNQGIGMSCSGPAETYSLITSVPATSQPISVGVLVNKQQKEENTTENENVYHLYCTIPDEPVHSKAG